MIEWVPLRGHAGSPLAMQLSGGVRSCDLGRIRLPCLRRAIEIFELSRDDILDVAVAQTEAEIEPDGLLDDDARKPVAVVGELVQKRTLYGSPVPNQRVTVTVPATCLAARWPGR